MMYALILTLVFTVTAAAQTSVKAVAGNTRFTSVEGRFTIALPKDGAEFEALKPSTDAPKESGGRYTWALDEGVMIIEYSDDPDFVIKTKKDYADLAEGMVGGIAATGTLSSKGPFRLGTYRGYQTRSMDKNRSVSLSRMLIVGKRRYTMFGLTRPGTAASAEAFIRKSLNSFRLIPDKK